ncbi:MAG: M6 family metalloprotease domain-containing protein [Candidatus Marinimicrobia bacterium]|nr:M6 family metalloprotease domain-containing protein [Candidatus Neomarinimicrobiota bacterium]
MKTFLLIVALLLNYTLLFAASAPKKGVRMTAEVREAIREMAKYYGKGNLPELLRNRARLMKSISVEPIPQEFKFPVVAGNFSDTPGDRYPIGNLQRELFDGPWPTGTMKEMYLEQSYGQFVVDGTVHGWFDVSKNEAWYTNGTNGLGAEGRAANFVKELVIISDDSIDYGQYDNNNDGWVESVIIVHAGYGGETGSDGIWSHRWSLNGSGLGFYTTNDTNASGILVKVNDYIIQPALSGSSGSKMIEIGVFCHEFGHAIGLPDLYDTDFSSEGIGEWGLMGGGTWGGDGRHPDTPSHMSPWSKEVLGWIQPIVLNMNKFNSLFYPVEDTSVVYKLWTGGNIQSRVSTFGLKLDVGTEYFLIEYRKQKKFDKYIHNSGFVIWHVDNRQFNNRNDNRRLVDVEEADGNMNGRGDPGDVYPGTTNATSFGLTSRSNSRSNDGENTFVEVFNISLPGSTMTANLNIEEGPNLLVNFIWAEDDGENDAVNRMEAGETGKLYLNISNVFAGAANTASLGILTDETGISIPDFLFDFSILGDTTKTLEFTIPFAVGEDFFPPRMVDFDVIMFTGAYEFLSTGLSIPIGFPDMLIVKSDLNDNIYEDFYTSVLDSMGKNYELWNQSHGTPNLFSNRSTLIWFSGDADSQTVSAEYQDSLSAFLDNGGNLLITGKNIGNDIGDTDFFQNYLHTRWIGESSRLLFEGSEGSFTEGMLIGATGGDGADNQGNEVDLLLPDSHPASHAIFDNTDGVVATAINSDYNVVYLGFGFEAVTAHLSSLTSRDTLMTAIMDWFETIVSVDDEKEIVRPLAFGLEQNYPNPFNPLTEINYSIDKAGQTKLVIYNLLGQKVVTLVDRFKLPGRFRVQWDASKFASGVYFYKLTTGENTKVRKMLFLK